MPLTFPFILLCLTMCGFVAIGTMTYFLGASRPERRFPASLMALGIAALVAFTPLVNLAANPEARAALQDKARGYALGQENSVTTPSQVVVRRETPSLGGRKRPRRS